MPSLLHPRQVYRDGETSSKIRKSAERVRHTAEERIFSRSSGVCIAGKSTLTYNPRKSLKLVLYWYTTEAYGASIIVAVVFHSRSYSGSPAQYFFLPVLVQLMMRTFFRSNFAVYISPKTCLRCSLSLASYICTSPWRCLIWFPIFVAFVGVFLAINNIPCVQRMFLTHASARPQEKPVADFCYLSQFFSAWETGNTKKCDENRKTSIDFLFRILPLKSTYTRPIQQIWSRNRYCSTWKHPKSPNIGCKWTKKTPKMGISFDLMFGKKGCVFFCNFWISFVYALPFLWTHMLDGRRRRKLKWSNANIFPRGLRDRGNTKWTQKVDTYRAI